ncbi:MAG: GGDEF domain-containing protein [Deltaproteobacteria bacterium]|nr:GGDEF domain-containing protein [Deltaproteobacteria bacterium]
MGDDDAMDLGWDDESDRTRVAAAPAPEAPAAGDERERAYLIVLVGNDVGKVFKLAAGETSIGRAHGVDVRIDDDSISRRHALVRVGEEGIVIEDLGSVNGTVVNGERIRLRQLADGDKIRLGDTTVVKFSFHDALEESFQQQIYDAALRDPLTKAYNKRHFLARLAQEMDGARRHGAPLSLVLLDLDHFKQVNDTYGHVAGDRVLVQLATVARDMIRAEDLLARYGGEEFGILLRGIALEAAGALGERLRAAIEASTTQWGEARVRITLSAGVAELDPGMREPEDLIRAADEALYAAKNAGRNRVLLHRKP